MNLSTFQHLALISTRDTEVSLNQVRKCKTLIIEAKGRNFKKRNKKFDKLQKLFQKLTSQT